MHSGEPLSDAEASDSNAPYEPLAPVREQSVNVQHRLATRTEGAGHRDIETMDSIPRSAGDIDHMSSTAKVRRHTQNFSPNRREYINSIYTHVVWIRGNWVELSCRKCGANATSQNTTHRRFLAGVFGFLVHLQRIHRISGLSREGKRVLKYLHQRPISATDARLMTADPPRPPRDVPIHKIGTKLRRSEYDRTEWQARERRKSTSIVRRRLSSGSGIRRQRRASSEHVRESLPDSMASVSSRAASPDLRQATSVSNDNEPNAHRFSCKARKTYIISDDEEAEEDDSLSWNERRQRYD